MWTHCIRSQAGSRIDSCEHTASTVSQAAGFAAVGTLHPQLGSRSCSCEHTASTVRQTAEFAAVGTLLLHLRNSKSNKYFQVLSSLSVCSLDCAQPHILWPGNSSTHSQEGSPHQVNPPQTCPEAQRQVTLESVMWTNTNLKAKFVIREKGMIRWLVSQEVTTIMSTFVCIYPNRRTSAWDKTEEN